ncbi:CBS domain-containing protein [Chloroflexota bacterium]
MVNVPDLVRILGVNIRVHYTWSVALVLITAAVVTQFPPVYPMWQRITLGIVASLLFFIAASIREFFLSFTAISKGIRLRNVTLFVFGGMSRLGKEATLPILEGLLTAIGLLSILIIAVIFYVIYAVLVNAGSVLVAALVQWLAFIYSLLFLFHLVPGFPLSGGRALRALLWKTTGDYDRATLVTSWTGRIIGLLLMAGGIWVLVVGRQWFTGLLLLFVGWVLQIAAEQSRRQAVLHKALRGVTAQDIMSKECPLVTEQFSIGQLVRDCILVTGQDYFIVAGGDILQGIVTMRNIKRIPKRRWRSTRIGDIMTPASKIETAYPQQPAASLLDQMDESRINRMPVLEKDKVIGVVARDSLIRFVRIRAELGI